MTSLTSRHGAFQPPASNAGFRPATGFRPSTAFRPAMGLRTAPDTGLDTSTVVMRALSANAARGLEISPKRIFDAVVAGLVFTLTLPVQLVVAALIRIKMGGPVLFRQERIGQYGQRFTLVKFRSMRQPDPRRDRNADADRLTPFGRWLRATSLDELPTLWNVIRGDMSLVGPRPLLPSYLDRYTLEQAQRHDVRPGITGWAQINGRNALDWEARFTLDLWYVDNLSFVLDMKILLATVTRVLSRSGVSAEGHATMPEFAGSRRDVTVPQPTLPGPGGARLGGAPFGGHHGGGHHGGGQPFGGHSGDGRIGAGTGTGREPIRPEFASVRRGGRHAINGRPGVALYRAGAGLVRRLTLTGQGGLR